MRSWRRAIGQRIDREGARRILIAGSVMMALALVIIAMADHYITFALGWLGLGIAMSFALTSATVPALVQIAGPRARRAVTALTVMTGVTSTIFMPLSAWLDAHYGWRNVFLIYAGLHLLVCLPIHWLVLPRGRPERVVSKSRSDDATWDGLAPESRRSLLYWLIALWTSVQSLVVWGFNMQAINIFTAMGLSQSAAIGVWMLSGPSQALLRAGELFSGSRHSIFRVAVLSALLAPFGFTLFLMFGASMLTAGALAILFGSGLGLYSIARQIIPLRLFGVARFGSVSGQLTLPQNVATAFAPLLFAAVLGSAGPVAATILALVCALVALAALIALVRLSRTS